MADINVTIEDAQPINVSLGEAVNVYKSVNDQTGGDVVLDADDISDTDTTNKFVTATEKQRWDAKQDALVSGTNIKTLNGESLLGEGDIEITGGGGSSGGSSVVFEQEFANDTATLAITGLDLDVEWGYELDIYFAHKNGSNAWLSYNNHTRGYLTERRLTGTGVSVTSNIGSVYLINGNVASFVNVKIMKGANKSFIGFMTRSDANAQIITTTFASGNAYGGDENITTLNIGTDTSLALPAGSRVVLRKLRA